MLRQGHLLPQNCMEYANDYALQREVLHYSNAKVEPLPKTYIFTYICNLIIISWAVILLKLSQANHYWTSLVDIIVTNCFRILMDIRFTKS